jgi:photosystem II stability/assembly factor-like uncharacterized protein
VVGGDYLKEQEPGANLARTSDGGRTWTFIGETRLPSFRSAVAWVPGAGGGMWLAVGPAGSDYSLDEGATWAALPGPGFHAVSAASAGAAWAVGEGGRIAKLGGNLDELVAPASRRRSVPAVDTAPSFRQR